MIKESRDYTLRSSRRAILQRIGKVVNEIVYFLRSVAILSFLTEKNSNA